MTLGKGSDSYGTTTYSSPQEMWESEHVLPGHDTNPEWYERGRLYYDQCCDATMDGVLGGYSHISDMDIEFSKTFLVNLYPLDCPNTNSTTKWSGTVACECGAGIGRVSKGLLLPLGVSQCDLIESCEKLLMEAPVFIGEENANICRFYCQGLQEWVPKEGTAYSIIWIQWVLCYLVDDDIVAFLRRCGKALAQDGVIILKENACVGESFVLDKDDASVTRSLPYWLNLIHDAGLRVVKQDMQSNFPDELFPVPMFALDVDPNAKDD
jgi:protein N-terminal methyltransferase